MSQNPPKSQAQIDFENAEAARERHAPASLTQEQIDAENERRRQEAARDRGPAIRTGLTQAEIDAEAQRRADAARRAPEFGHPGPSRTQEQINAENEAAQHRAANPKNARAGDFVHNQARTAEPRFPDSPIPGDTFHERDAPLRTGTKTGPLPGNFPGRLQLKVAGFPTYETARTITQLSSIAGIDGPTQKLIEAGLKE